MARQPDSVLLAKLERAEVLLKQTEKGYVASAPRWKRAMQLIDEVEASLAPPPAPRVPALGPLHPAGKPLLLERLTHLTSRIRWPAFDGGWKAGMAVIAPEPLTITKQSGSKGGDAFYARGQSKIEYWFGHIAGAPATGKTFAKGARMCVIANIGAGDGGPHLHLGLNTIPLVGQQLKYGRTGSGPPYTIGAPTIGAQLAALMDT